MMPKGGKPGKGMGKGHEKKGPKGEAHGYKEKPGKRLGQVKRAEKGAEEGLAETKSAVEEFAEKLPED